MAGDMAVMLDSGVRRGTDVLKALALGADFVFVGRPFLYAAAVGGEAGVRHAINLLWEEIDREHGHARHHRPEPDLARSTCGGCARAGSVGKGRTPAPCSQGPVAPSS